VLPGNLRERTGSRWVFRSDRPQHARVGVEALYAQRGLANSGRPTSASSTTSIVPVFLRALFPTPGCRAYRVRRTASLFRAAVPRGWTDCPNTNRPSTSYAAVIGGGVRLGAASAFHVEGRYIYGLTDLKLSTVTSSESYKTRSFAILAGGRSSRESCWHSRRAVGSPDMRHRNVILAALLLGASASARRQRAPARAAAAPNVILVLMDDMGYGDLGSYGAPDVRTPNIDRLAREGVRLTDAYANGAVCTPTRTALITGRYQQRVALEWASVPRREIESSACPRLGRRCRRCSKPTAMRPGSSANGTSAGTRVRTDHHGFDEFYGFLSGAHDYYTRTSDGPPICTRTRPDRTRRVPDR